MSKELQVVASERLKSVLVQDKKENPIKIINVLKSELLYVLKNYMEVTPEDIDFDIVVNAEGKYIVNFQAKVHRLKVSNYIV